MRTRSSACSKPESRSTTAHQSAISLYDWTKKLSAVLDLLKGADRLHEPAEPKLAPEVAGRRDDGRDDPRALVA